MELREKKEVDGERSRRRALVSNENRRADIVDGLEQRHYKSQISLARGHPLEVKVMSGVRHDLAIR